MCYSPKAIQILSFADWTASSRVRVPLRYLLLISIIWEANSLVYNWVPEVEDKRPSIVEGWSYVNAFLYGEMLEVRYLDKKAR